MRKPTLPFIIVALLLLLAAPVWADGGVQATLTPDRDELTVGDPVQLALEVTHPTGYQVIIPQLEPTWGPFEVRSQSGVETRANGDGSETTRQTIEVTLFDLGEFQTPELPLTISDDRGQVFQEMVPAVSLTVVPTLAEEDNDLRDIKPQAALKVPATWPWIAGGLLLAAAVIAGGYWAYRRWRGQPLFAPAVDDRPAWQAALDELARIEKLGLLADRRFKEYYTLLTDALRAYLEGQFDLSVFERTTTELRPVLRQSDLTTEHSRRFLALFAESDLVKFAKFVPDVEAARQALAEARDLVEATRPQPEPELEKFLTETNQSTPKQSGLPRPRTGGIGAASARV